MDIGLVGRNLNFLFIVKVKSLRTLVLRKLDVSVAGGRGRPAPAFNVVLYSHALSFDPAIHPLLTQFDSPRRDNALHTGFPLLFSVESALLHIWSQLRRFPSSDCQPNFPRHVCLIRKHSSPVAPKRRLPSNCSNQYRTR